MSLPSLAAAGIGIAGAVVASKDMPSSTDDQSGEGLSTVAKMAIGAAAALAAPRLIGEMAVSGGKAAAKGLWNNKRAIADSIADGAITTAEKTIGAVSGAARGVLYPAAQVGKSLTDIIIEQSPTRFKDNFMNLGMTNRGKLIIGAAGIAAGFKGGWDRYNESRSGQMVGAAGPTPEITMENPKGTMADMYGAGGDLVFALNHNRRG